MLNPGSILLSAEPVSIITPLVAPGIEKIRDSAICLVCNVAKCPMLYLSKIAGKIYQVNQDFGPQNDVSQ